MSALKIWLVSLAFVINLNNRHTQKLMSNLSANSDLLWQNSFPLRNLVQTVMFDFNHNFSLIKLINDQY